MNSLRKAEQHTESPHDSIKALRDRLVAASQNSVVFFGGAGVSTESGIPDFRSADGLYAQKFAYPPETMLSRSFFDTHPAEFFDFYFSRVVTTDAQPNRTHKKLAELERSGQLIGVITQNIDGLHQAAGSKTVYELHGSILRNFCMSCKYAADVHEMIALAARSHDGVPHCPHCGGVMKPDVVLYEEPLNEAVMYAAIGAIEHADTMVVAGTSLVVHPAAGLLHYFHGSCLAIVNKSPTPRDRDADILINASIGDAFDF